jgi:hypothetical protein
MSEVEKDRYELDTSTANENLKAMLESLQRLEHALGESASAAGGTEAATGELAGAVALGTLAFEVGKRAAEAFFEAVKEGVGGVVANQRAIAQLKVVAGEYTEVLAEQAEKLEHLRGVSAEEVMAAQAILIRFGVHKEKVDAVTRSILDYAKATNTDLVSATQMMARAVENGGGKIETLGVDLKLTGKAAADMTITATELAKKFGGAAEADSNTVAGRAKLASVAFDDLKKHFGGMVIDFAEKHQVLEKLTRALEGLQLALTGDSESIKRTNEVIALQEHLTGNLERKKQLLRGIAEIEAAGGTAPKSRAEIAHLDENIAKLKEMIRLHNEEIGLAEKGPPVPKEGPDRNTKHGDEEAVKAAEAAEKRRTAELEANEKAMARSVEIEMKRREAEKKDKLAADKLYDDKEKAEAKHLQVIADIRKASNEDQAKVWERENKRLMANAEKARKEIEGSFGKVLDFGKQALGEIASLVEQPLTEFLTTNAKYKEEYLTATIERRRLSLEEQGIIKTTAQLRAEAEKENNAAQADRLSKTLASLAMEAGKNALMQVGEGIAALAEYNYPGAALHFAAAGAFGLLAGGAAGASYAISQGRGQTTAERESLEAAKKKDAASATARDASQSSQSGAKKKGDTVIEVYNLGITGQTRTAQARELARIQAEYNGLVSLGGQRP